MEKNIQQRARDYPRNAGETGWKPVSRSFAPFDKKVEIRKRRRNLPHWEQGGCTYFVTFRLADALSQAKLGDFVEQRTRWFGLHPKPWTVEVWEEYRKRFGDPVQKWLDAGYGSCALRRPEVRQIVEDALRHFDGDRYDLGEFVVMPNHVHVLVTPRAKPPKRDTDSQSAERGTGFQSVSATATETSEPRTQPEASQDQRLETKHRLDVGDTLSEGNRLEACATYWSLSEIVHSWKSFTSNRINRLLKRRGTLWMDENFDHAVRTVEQLEYFEAYIRENPAKAGISDP